MAQQTDRLQSAAVELGGLAARGELSQYVADAIRSRRQRRVQLHLVGEAGEAEVLVGRGRVQQTDHVVPRGNRRQRELGVAHVHQEHDGGRARLRAIGGDGGRGQGAASQTGGDLLRLRRREATEVAEQPRTLGLPAGELHPVTEDVIVVGRGRRGSEEQRHARRQAAQPGDRGRESCRLHQCRSNDVASSMPGRSVGRGRRGPHLRYLSAIAPSMLPREPRVQPEEVH